MLETIREYALIRLAQRGELAALQRGHAAHYLAAAETAMMRWDGAAGAQAAAQLTPELNNIRGALQWARDGGDVPVGLQLAGMLWRFWCSEGLIAEGGAWLGALLDRADTLPGLAADLPPAARSARLLGTVAAAWLASDQQDFVRARQLLDQSVRWRQALAQTEEKTGALHTAALQASVLETHLLHTEALQARVSGEYGRATALLEDALARGRALIADGLGHVLYDMGYSLYMLALVLREHGETARAIALFEECIAFHRRVGDREGVAQGLLGLGDVARDVGDAARLRRYTEESLAIYRAFGTQWAIGFALNNLAQAAYIERDLPQALALIQESAAMFRTQQADGSLAEALITMGHILRASGDLPAAYAAAREALRLTAAVGPHLMLTNAIESLACAAAGLGRAPLAARLLAASARLRAQMGTPVRPVDRAAVDLARVAASAALDDDALAHVSRTAEIQPLEQLIAAISESEQ